MNYYIDKLEKKFGKYAIPNISLYLALMYSIGYVIMAININWLDYLRLNPYRILHGEVWRLVTWFIIPHRDFNVFFVLLFLYVFYMFGSYLEQAMGAFRYNLYLFSGLVFTVLGSFALQAFLYLSGAIAGASPEATELIFANLSTYFSTFYVYMSIFLAIAVIYPDMTIYLMFIIPIKMKVVGIVYGFLIVLNFLGSDLVARVVIAASLLNFIIFFTAVHRKHTMTPGQVHKRTVYRRELDKVRYAGGHKCAICGVTDKDEPEREFRYCSKCHGNYEYCDVHLYTHAHVEEGEKK
ncbi:MAG: hypothetical protein LBI54_00070 [Lachnospiraceae bacterium]|jgi:hypothetical protein|nr:hypothetical protein [Lachnospiraceae bacterium]